MVLEAGELCGGWVGPGARKSAAGRPGPTQLAVGADGKARLAAARGGPLRRGRGKSPARLSLLLLAGTLLLEVARDRPSRR
jgi:hypothetical protein